MFQYEFTTLAVTDLPGLKMYVDRYTAIGFELYQISNVFTIGELPCVLLTFRQRRDPV